MNGMIKLFTSEILLPSLLGVNSRSCHRLSNFCHAKNNWEYDVAKKSRSWRTRAVIDEEYQDIHSNDYSITSNSNSCDVINDYPNFYTIGYEINRSQTHSIAKNETDCLLDFVEDKGHSNRSRFGMRMTNVICFLSSSTSATQHQNQPTSNE